MECTNCFLCKTRRNIVKNKGDKTSSILFVLDYPSRSDDVIGEICSGQEGRLLEILMRDAFEIINSTGKNYFVTSLLRCLPVENDIVREPNELEILACMYNLLRTINRINFKYTFLVGKLSEKYLADELPGSVVLQPLGMLVKQGGQQSHWYKHNLRKITEGLK